MEKRLNKKIEIYVSSMKDAIRAKILEIGFDEKAKINDLLEYIYEYDRLVFNKDDFVKRKRIKNSIPQLNRCIAKRACGEQCTRRRRSDCSFCGTHYKGTPHGVITETETRETTNQKMEVVAQEIGGIVYYIDKYSNVYNTEEILQGSENPQIIAKYVKNGTKYSIPEFGLM